MLLNDDNFNLKCTVFSFELVVSFRMIMLCFAKYETYETGFRMQKPVSRNKEYFFAKYETRFA